MAFLQSVINETRKIEAVLKSVGATSKGLHGMASDVEHKISSLAMRKIRYIATIRNRLVHEENYSFDGDEAKFLADCQLVVAELATVNRKASAAFVSSHSRVVQESNYSEFDEGESLDDCIDPPEVESVEEYRPFESPDIEPTPVVPESKPSASQDEPPGDRDWMRMVFAYIREWSFTEDEEVRNDRSFFISAVIFVGAFAWFAYQQDPFLTCICLSWLIALVSFWVVWFWEHIVLIAFIASIACMVFGGLYGVYLLIIGMGALLH